MKFTQRYSLLFLALMCTVCLPVYADNQLITIKDRTLSPGNTLYYVDAQNGNDNNAGNQMRKAWKTLNQLNMRIFSAGDRIIISGPANFGESLHLVAKGDSKKHVKLIFLKGTYNFYPDKSFKKQFFISNTNDDTYTPKAIALYIDSSRYVDIEASGAKMIMHGKMMETCIDYSQNITIHGAAYNYLRPTVSELQVISVGDKFADVKIHPDSKYRIKDSLLTWEGKGWRYNPISLWQVLEPSTGHLQRTDINMNGLKYVETAPGSIRIFFKNNSGFKTGHIYQNRDVTRDCVGIFLLRSKNVALKNININFMHGMGVVSQFCENINIDSVFVRPEANSGRTSAAWADILHFSGCKGKITITNSYLSGANDDAVNVHGTYLRIVDKPKPNQLLVRFMHGQTYGFEAFTKGDSIGLVNAKNLLQYGANMIVKTERINDKDILLTLAKPLTDSIQANDVVENISWTPEVYIGHNIITQIPTRGILVTTRRKTVIEDNTFLRTNNSAISVADDASSWFESGMVKNLTIRNNRFDRCGGPVISIAPENTENSAQKVHSNIVVTNNQFILLSPDAFHAKSSYNIKVVNNIFKLPGTTAKEEELIKFQDCSATTVTNNKISTEK